MSPHPNTDRNRLEVKSPGIYIYLVAGVAALGGLLFGYDLAVVSGAIIFLSRRFALSPAAVGFAIGSSQIGCMIAPFAVSSICDRWGRKLTLVATALLFAISAVGTSLSQNPLQFNMSRIVAGLAIGFASIVSPMYIAEVAPARIRGRLVTLNQLAIGAGALVSYAVSYYLSFAGNWRLMFGLAALPSLGFLIGLAFIPQSPRWLVQASRIEEAEKILARIEGPVNAREELRSIQGSVSIEQGRLSELFRPGIRTALIIAISLCLFQGWCGGTAVNFYAPILFQRTQGSSVSHAILLALFLNISSLICAFVSLLLVDIFGRRPLLLIGSAGMALTQMCLGFFLRGTAPASYAIVTVFLLNICYQLSFAPIAWLILSEIFPMPLRAKGQAVGSFAVWMSTYLSNQFLAPLMNYFEHTFGSVGAAFWLFAVVCVAGFLFSWAMVPETRGKSLEEIAAWWLTPEKVASKGA